MTGLTGDICKFVLELVAPRSERNFKPHPIAGTSKENFLFIIFKRDPPHLYVESPWDLHVQ